MVAGATISVDLSDDDWLADLEKIGEQHGAFAHLGDDHAAVFIESSSDVLFVCFETLFGLRSASETAMPLAFSICDEPKWSHLTIIARSQKWYRDEEVYAYFDQLTDNGFFDDFDEVVFYGAGMCGYAAGAFSVAAPGASVLMLAPQATIERSRTVWDQRFPSARRIDTTSRYAYAPDMIEAAETAVVVYDPDEIEDAMHASLFRGDNIFPFKYRRGRAGAIEADFRSLSLIPEFVKSATEAKMNQAALAKIMKARKNHVPYLRALLARVLNEDRPRLTVKLCRQVLKHHDLPRFQQHLETAENRLASSKGVMNGHSTDHFHLS